jgi:hypothetical protein
MRRFLLVLLAFFCITSLSSCASQLDRLKMDKQKLVLGGAHFMKAASGCDTNNDGVVAGLEWVKLVKDFIASVKAGNPDAAPIHPAPRD